MQVPDCKSFIWQYYEIFFKGYYQFPCAKANPVIIDCGANIGISIIDFKRQYPLAEIHAFEPDDHIFNILSDNINNYSLKHVTLHNQAVWIKDEELSFESEGADGGKISHDSDQSKKVDAIDFARFLNRFEHVNFLKIDIEGAETKILPHIQGELYKVDNIFVEFHSFNDQAQHLNDVIQALSSNGHRIYIDNINFKNSPFINKKGKYRMDLQLNIFAYRP